MKQSLLILLLIISTSVNAQKIIVTPDGVKSESDTSKDYVVIDVPGKTAPELYASLITYLQKSYNDPEKVTKGKVLNEYVHFTPHVNAIFISKPGMGVKNAFDADYTTQINIKDEKIKISFINIKFTPQDYQVRYTYLFTQDGMMHPGIFNSKGKLKEPEIKSEIEAYFNNQLTMIGDFLKGKIKKEEW